MLVKDDFFLLFPNKISVVLYKHSLLIKNNIFPSQRILATTFKYHSFKCKHILLNYLSRKTEETSYRETNKDKQAVRRLRIRKRFTFNAETTTPR